MNRIHPTTAKAIATPRPVLVTANSEAEEALRRVQGRPAPIRPPANTVPLPSSEFLADLTRRLATTPDRTFTAESLRFVLTMSARLTHRCDEYNTASGRTWRKLRNGSHSTREDRERVIKDATDMADYAWDEATADGHRAYVLLVDTTVPVMTAADLLARIQSVSVRTAVAA